MLKDIYQFHYHQYRRIMDRFVDNLQIFCNASKLSFESLDFPRAIITAQIDSAKAAIVTAANFSSMEHERSYIDDDSIRLPFPKVTRSAISGAHGFFNAGKAREVKGFPNISRVLRALSVSSK